MEYNIKTTTIQQHRAILSILMAEGFLWHGETTWTAFTASEKFFSGYPHITYDVGKKYIWGQKFSPSGKTLTSIEEVIETITNSKVVVIDNFAGTEYTATITSESVKVGCQTISKDKVEELYDLMLKSPNCSWDWDDKQPIYKMVINLKESAPPQTLQVGDYTATVCSDAAFINRCKITKENIELVLKHFDELSN